MTGVGLVRHELAEGGRQHGQVDVDLDSGTELAEVVVEAAPRLVGDEGEVDPLALGQAEQSPGPVPQVLGKRGDGPLESCAGTACASRQAT